MLYTGGNAMKPLRPLYQSFLVFSAICFSMYLITRHSSVVLSVSEMTSLARGGVPKPKCLSNPQGKKCNEGFECNDRETQDDCEYQPLYPPKCCSNTTLNTNSCRPTYPWWAIDCQTSGTTPSCGHYKLHTRCTWADGMCICDGVEGDVDCPRTLISFSEQCCKFDPA